ncbi:DUF721 domain-containing protein [Brevibacterium sp. 5221]|uniref:DUF721 domain-containing protein n=1 Tax=Brevibacterium rongguiense TaxID=2695267 RepID=A0A6N9H875_9MICO|nr:MULTISPECIES: DciA family protein [Brevibacterium]MYM20173.1 DUF721 domain-containing protein [Brevibacterium rongguiense]WAL39564.1 DciA family protein [Brevibacterium sp. BRM-1]
MAEPAGTPIAALEALDRVRRMGDVAAGRYTGSLRRTVRSIAEVSYTGAGADARDPKPLVAEIRTLTQARGWRASLDVGALMGRWPELVGQDVAAHCEPETCDPPALVVRASSTTWATQLRLMSQALLDRLERELGRRVIDEITILGPAQRSWKHGRRSVRGRGPRDTYG